MGAETAGAAAGAATGAMRVADGMPAGAATESSDACARPSSRLFTGSTNQYLAVLCFTMSRDNVSTPTLGDNFLPSHSAALGTGRNHPFYPLLCKGRRIPASPSPRW